jgi:hypothetical protein
MSSLRIVELYIHSLLHLYGVGTVSQRNNFIFYLYVETKGPSHGLLQSVKPWLKQMTVCELRNGRCDAVFLVEEKERLGFLDEACLSEQYLLKIFHL